MKPRNQDIINIVRAYLIIPVFWFMYLNGWFPKTLAP